MATLEQANKQMMNMYGCDLHQFKESVKDSFTYKVTGGWMVIASLMSDAQEMIEFDPDGARKVLNKAKALVFDMAQGEMTFGKM
jgi:hypothetical protein